jgi:CRISPR-associated protein Csm4
MAPATAYILTFRSPLHVGERGVGLETARTHVPADTLFSALCSAWRVLYGVEALYRDVLDWFLAGDGSEPFFLTSAFPWGSSVRFFPRPLLRSRGLTLEAEDEKLFKRIRFISERVFAALLRGDSLTFRVGDCINGEAAWVTAEEKQHLQTWADDATGDVVLWKNAVVPRVTLDRISSASEIWHFGEMCFAHDTGLWLAVAFNADHGDELRRRFTACLRLLGDTGLGGERGAGHGLFTVGEPQELALAEAPAASHFVTLAPVCPRDAAEATRLADEGSTYELLTRRGWVTSPEGSHLRRKTVRMFAEGSVLAGRQVRAGRLADVTPEAFVSHRVFRYGYAFPVGAHTP